MPVSVQVEENWQLLVSFFGIDISLVNFPFWLGRLIGCFSWCCKMMHFFGSSFRFGWLNRNLSLMKSIFGKISMFLASLDLACPFLLAKSDIFCL